MLHIIPQSPRWRIIPANPDLWNNKSEISNHFKRSLFDLQTDFVLNCMCFLFCIIYLIHQAFLKQKQLSVINMLLLQMMIFM